MKPEHEALKLAAMAADQGGQHIYTNPRDSNNWRNNDIWHAEASPAAILALLAENAALRAQVEAQQKRKDRAERALLRSGFVDNGAPEWKPPMGPAPRFIEVEAQPVPGWQLVPVEPTPHMFEHARNAGLPAVMLDSITARTNLRISTEYRAMLAAAPIPPAPAQAKEGT